MVEGESMIEVGLRGQQVKGLVEKRMQEIKQRMAAKITSHFQAPIAKEASAQSANEQEEKMKQLEQRVEAQEKMISELKEREALLQAENLKLHKQLKAITKIF